MTEFAGLLNQRIVIERQAGARSPTGLRDDLWEEVARCAAGVAPLGAAAEREAMSFSAMPCFKVLIRARANVEVDQRVRWKERVLMIRAIRFDPAAPERFELKCEEVRA